MPAFKPDYSVHPGEILAEVLEELNISQRVAATAIGVSEQYMSQVIHGARPITPKMAERLESLGITRSFWMALQRNYDDFQRS